MIARADQLAGPGWIIRPARLTDVASIQALIATFAARQLMLGRSTADVCDHLREFLVVADDAGRIHACAAIRIYSESIAELRSLAVDATMHGHGLGRFLVEGCVREAQRWGLQRLICLTYRVGFFARLGFVRVDRSRFPHKVWSDCVRCPSFLDCSEVAMWRTLNALVDDSRIGAEPA
jgi:amino-acid N-acetyltransferase